MASVLLRSAARSSRSTASSSSPSLSRAFVSQRSSTRMLSTTPAVLAEVPTPQDTAQTRGAKNVFDYHTVEDLQGMHASQILAETGTRADAKMRHFTGMWGPFLFDE
ncbi:hypothetical protein D9758_010303 [Tetrapyrgos nigripes]|uniref:Uncharacterized protein n=1 Tax=Tetrapyrgos nigripes TaxID=182062 RepID=A0A8H5GAB3_9AGAR|nr:hypothetical protein D9758_010303 [Tetrapyrgos nigripes]